MKSMLFSALMIFALASTGCALQTGSGGAGQNGYSDGLVLSGNSGCQAPKGLTPSCSLLRKPGDNRGMALRVNQKGSACNQNRGSGLFSRMRGQTVAPAASMGCDSCGTASTGCDSCGTGSVGGASDCGCNGSVGVGSAVVSTTDGACGCGDASCGSVGGSAGGLLGRVGSKSCGCGPKGKLGGRSLFGGKAKAASMGCDSCGTASVSGASDCGCNGAVSDGSDVVLATDGACGCGDASCGSACGSAVAGGLLGKVGSKRCGCGLNCKPGGCRLLGGKAKAAASMGCDSCGTASMSGASDCGCDGAVDVAFGAGKVFVSLTDGASGCEDASCGSAGDSAVVGGLLGKVGSNCGGCGLKDKLGGCCLFGGKAKAAVAGNGCGVQGCGVGGKLCGGCLSKHRGPYGGAIPHTAQGPGNGTGMAPSYAYPYYTTRGPRDFLMKNPPSIGY